jgi:RNA polymerase sigma factor (sigma-70 family)
MASRPQPPGPDAGRAALLDRLLHRHGARLRRQARRNSSSAADAEDALQDACIQFLRSYNAPLELSAALPWLLLAVKHSAWKLGARRRRCEALVALTCTDSADDERPALTVLDERPGPAERAERFEHLTGCIALLQRLKPDERTAIVLHALGYSYREIMAHQGWTYTKVNRCLVEGRAALRELDRGRDRTADRSYRHE